MIQSPFTTLGQETRWAYYTMLPSQHRAIYAQTKPNKTKAWFRSLLHHPAMKSIRPIIQSQGCTNNWIHNNYKIYIYYDNECRFYSWQHDIV